MIDKIFKIGILVLGIIFLLLYSQHSQNGRFLEVGSFSVFDTETGKSYVIPSDSIELRSGEMTVFNPHTNTFEIRKLKRKEG